jgi:hypothetical protein
LGLRADLGSEVAESTWRRVLWRVALGVSVIVSTYWIGGFYLWPDAGNLFLDAHIYYQATAEWLNGGNPWTVAYRGVRFAGIPPTLLLNLPLVPFGERVAVVFWVVANSISIAYVIYRLRLPIWTALLLPVVEGWLAASPDLALAGLVVVGVGSVSALTKPYSVPVLAADRRWRALVVTMVAGLLTVPILPWSTFVESRDLIARSFAQFAGYPPSASGVVPLLALVGLSLLTLGWRRGLILSVPGLFAQQPHYIVFSLESVKWSRLLALSYAIPIPHAAAIGVVLFALAERLTSWRSRAARLEDPAATGRVTT